jgi:hypothetical protein
VAVTESWRWPRCRLAWPLPGIGADEEGGTVQACPGRAVLLAPGILSPRKDHRQGRTSSLRCGRSTLTLIFHGKTRHLSGGRGRLLWRLRLLMTVSEFGFWVALG